MAVASLVFGQATFGAAPLSFQESAVRSHSPRPPELDWSPTGSQLKSAPCNGAVNATSAAESDRLERKRASEHASARRFEETGCFMGEGFALRMTIYSR